MYMLFTEPHRTHTAGHWANALYLLQRGNVTLGEVQDVK